MTTTTMNRSSWLMSSMMVVGTFVVISEGYVQQSLLKSQPQLLSRNNMAFVVPTTSSTSSRITSSSASENFSIRTTTSSTTSLYAKKKKKNSPASAALEALEALEAMENQADDSSSPIMAAGDEPLSKKELKELEKQKKKQAKQQQKQQKDDEVSAKKMSKKEEMLMKALEMEAMDEEKSVSMMDDDKPKLSKKELKALKKKEEKMAAKMEKKKKKKQQNADDADESMDDGVADLKLNGDADVVAAPVEETTTAPKKPMSKKEEMLMKALEMEALDNAASASSSFDDDDQPKLSKKELKALKKQEEKQAAKLAAKMEKKLKKQKQKQGLDFDDDDDDEVAVPDINGSTPPGTFEKSPEQLADEAKAAERASKPTLEDKIRKERPPPRIRVMESSQPDFTSLRLENVGITFRNQEVLKDVTWGVQTGERIGLVGANGAGKTTQLRIFSGELEPTTGDVVKSSKSVRVAMLRQEFIDELRLERTLREELLSVFEEENAILTELKENEEALSSADPNDADGMQNLLDRMQELQNLAENKNVYALEARVKKTMDLMGFTEDEGDDLVASFSGGWKMRIGLGRTLLRDPNVLLLDEPTNHLDLQSVEWLENFLRQQNIPMIIVSHDREFLDQVCTKIVDAEGGVCTEYDGNYSRFLQLKKARMDSWQAAYNAQEKKIKEEKQWINKFRVKQPQAVKQRQAKLDKLVKSEDYVKKPPFLGKPFKFRFPEGPRLSPEVAEVKAMSHAYRNEQTQNRLFEDVDLFVEKGDRIAVVGPNGSGKSTLLRLLMGREDPDGGKSGLMGANVVMNYFEQNQADALDLDKTVVETIQGASHGQSYNELRAYLGQFLFKGDAVEKKVRSLSGGEKARLSLCCMMLRPANFLILDEPTNHLDIPAKEMLEEALQHYQGSVMVVSHDRFFISRVATTIVAIEDKKLVKYQGDYKSYLEKSKHIKDKIEARYVPGVQRIEAAPVVDFEEINKPKRNFGGAKTAGMVTRKDKGIKNAKRMQQS